MTARTPSYLQLLLAEAGIETGAPLIVGVSGGPDSLALLHQLRNAVPPLFLHVAYLDHGLRPESTTEVEYVAGIADKWGLKFSTECVDVRSLSDSQGWSIEEAARNARYDFLARTAYENGASVVAVGHNADDQAETVLLHLLRGSGVTGLRGMLPVSTLPGSANLKLIRPLLETARAEIEAYCLKHDLQPLQDDSNDDATYFRNRLRHHLLPELAAYNPGIKKHLAQLAVIVSAEDAFLEEAADRVWPDLVKHISPRQLTLDRQRWRDLPLALQRRVIRRSVQSLSLDAGDLSFKTVAQALDLCSRQKAGLVMELTGGMTLLVDYDVLIFSSVSPDMLPTSLPQYSGQVRLPLSLPCEVVLDNNWVLTAESITHLPDSFTKEHDPWQAIIALNGRETLFLRTRENGERMQPLGMDGRSAGLQDIMVNRKISWGLRQNWPVVAVEGHAVWLIGHVIDHRVRVTPDSQDLVKLVCRRVES